MANAYETTVYADQSDELAEEIERLIAEHMAGAPPHVFTPIVATALASVALNVDGQNPGAACADALRRPAGVVAGVVSLLEAD